MKLYERFADKGYHTSIATTFGLDFDAYESIVLPRLRGAGCRNNILIADDRMVTYALSGASSLPRQAGKQYSVNGRSARGVFHPKLFLQLGRSGGRMIISSANMTSSGLAGNVELMGIIECGAEPSGESRLVASAWAYARRQLATSQHVVQTQIEWMRGRTPWLASVDAEPSVERLRDGTLAAVLATGDAIGIGQRFTDLIDEPVSRLIVISPYWDDELQALGALAKRLAPGEVSVLIDTGTASFPKDAVTDLQNLRLYARNNFREGRFLHAKAIIAQTASADHMLFGSANCTMAALGPSDYAGLNEEICLYRKLPAGSVLDVLEVASLLTDGNRIEPSALKPRLIEDEIPLEDLERQSPGQFEINVDTLTWYPASHIDHRSAKIELLDHEGGVISARMTLLGSSTPERPRYQLNGLTDYPAFAQIVRADGEHTAKAVVTLIGKLQSALRDIQSRHAEKQQLKLDLETDAHLSLLEILDVLERIESENRTETEPATERTVLEVKPEGEQSGQHSKLSYEEFLRGRRPRTTRQQGAHNSLEGSEVSIFRRFLNRILGMNAEPEEASEDDDGEVVDAAFNLSEETSDGGQQAPPDESLDNSKASAAVTMVDDEQDRNKQQRKATREHINQAVSDFHARIKARRNSGVLSSFDVLRLRALLMVVCSAAMPLSNSKAVSSSGLQVLPPQSDSNGWPLLLGRLVFALFGGKKPAIHKLIVRNDHDQLPDDIIECWATCYWCLCAALSLPLPQKDRGSIVGMLKPLAEKTYLLTLPSAEELMSDDVTTLMEHLSARYASSLGIDPAIIANQHRGTVDRLFKDPRAD